MVLIEEDFFIVSWDEGAKSIIGTWTGKQPTFEKLKTVFNKAIEQVSTTKAPNWLGDTRKMPTMSKEIELWMVQDWVPRAMAAGIKHFVTVIPASALSRLTLNSMTKNSKMDVAPSFATLEEAKEWLKTQA